MTGTSNQEEEGHSLTEIGSALTNYNIILMEAENLDLKHNLAQQLLQTIFGLYIPEIKDKVLPPLNKPPCQDVVKNIYSDIDELNKFYNSEVFKPPKTPYMSPIILLLKLAQEKDYPPPGSSKQKPKRRQKVRKNDQEQKGKEKEYRRKWGRVAPFKAYLDALRLRPNRGQYKQGWAGLPGCILSLVPVWTSHPPVISASNDNFPANAGLASIGFNERRAHLHSLVESCTPQSKKAIQTLQTTSYNFKQNYQAWIQREQGRSEDTHKLEAEVLEDDWGLQGTEEEERYIPEAEYNDLVENADVEPIHFPGILATWAPSGGYMPPCLLDYWRFRTLRPQMAEMEDHSDWEFDNKQKKWFLKKKVYGVTSCAEWAAFIELSAQRGVEATPPELW